MQSIQWLEVNSKHDYLLSSLRTCVSWGFDTVSESLKILLQLACIQNCKSLLYLIRILNNLKPTLIRNGRSIRASHTANLSQRRRPVAAAFCSSNSNQKVEVCNSPIWGTLLWRCTAGCCVSFLMVIIVASGFLWYWSDPTIPDMGTNVRVPSIRLRHNIELTARADRHEPKCEVGFRLMAQGLPILGKGYAKRAD